MSRDSSSRAVNRLAKWRSVFAGWQLGTRDEEDPECQAVRDHREATILLRAEFNALLGLLVKRGIFTEDEWLEALAAECDLLGKDYEAKFPGIHTTEYGVVFEMPEAVETMRKWRP
jgi:hypothetical protein